jgi:hypothetical protein
MLSEFGIVVGVYCGSTDEYTPNVFCELGVVAGVSCGSTVDPWYTPNVLSELVVSTTLCANDVDVAHIGAHGPPTRENPATGVIHHSDPCWAMISCPTDRMAAVFMGPQESSIGVSIM